jgi:hypothetical protein
MVSGAGCRRKGHDFERAIATALKPIFGEAKRGLSQCRGGTSEEPDVVLPEGVPLFIEAKRGKATNIKAALRQAASAALPSARWPVAVCKDDHREPTVTMLLADWLEMTGEWWSLRQQAGHVAAALDEVCRRDEGDVEVIGFQVEQEPEEEVAEWQRRKR